MGWKTEDREDGGHNLIGPDFLITMYVQCKGDWQGLRSIGFTIYQQTGGTVKQTFPGSVSLRLEGKSYGWLNFAKEAVHENPK